MALCLRVQPLWSDLTLGESIAVDGVCLTVTQFHDNLFWVDVSPETLQRTVLGRRATRGSVNLERALRLQDRLGGHLVLGHVDGVGRISAIQNKGGFQEWAVTPPAALLRYIAEKGSICVDGISLTVSRLEADRFWLALIPTTLAETTLPQRKVGDEVNLEVDLLARYVERLMAAGAAQTPQSDGPGALYGRLLENGFIR